MAPRGVKRAAERAAGASAKKQCAEVLAAIHMAESLPESCKEMMENVAKGCLPIFAANRHELQAQGVKMVEEVLAGVQKRLQEKVAEIQEKVHRADAEQSERALSEESARKQFTALEKNLIEAKEAVDSSKASLASAQDRLAASTADIESKNAEVASLGARKAKLETTMSSAYEPLKASGSKGHEGRKQLNALEAVLKDIELELGLIASLPDTMRKVPSARGTFDGLVQKKVEEGAARFVAETEQAINAVEISKPDLANAKAAAETALTEAQEQVTVSSTAHAAAEAAFKEGKEAVKVAQDAVANFSKEALATGKNLEAAKASLASFVDGPLKAFSELQHLAPAQDPEEPAQVAETMPVAEPAPFADVSQQGVAN